jgi:RNA recognition motif-containing protein
MQTHIKAFLFQLIPPKFLTICAIIFKVDAHAIYVRNLPLNAIPQQLEDEFKAFGAIKADGIQVRSNKVSVLFLKSLL